MREPAERWPGGADVVQEYASLLRSCRAIDLGRKIHSRIQGSGHGRSLFLGVLLIEMYGRCGSVQEAKATFDHCVPERNVFAWNALLTAFLARGRSSEVLSLFRDMCSTRVEPDFLSYVRALGACSRLRNLEAGQSIHAMVKASGFTLRAGLGTAILDMYGKCGRMKQARSVFDEMGALHTRTLVTWNAMITANAQNGHHEAAMRLYRQMDCEGLAADVFTLASLLNSCNFAQGVEIHHRTMAIGVESHVVLGTALVRMYGNFGRVLEAIAAFNKVAGKDVVCWTALITVLVQYSLFQRAIQVYKQMLSHELVPDQFTFSSILGACCRPEDLSLGREIHEQVLRTGCGHDHAVANSLVSMYGRCKSLEDAKLAFSRLAQKTLVSWNSIFLAHSECGDERGLVELYNTQLDMFPDAFILSRVLSACASLGDRGTGERIHRTIDSSVQLSSEVTLQNALITLYSRCGSLKRAKEVFDRVKGRDSVTWNAMISAASQYNDVEMSIFLSREMQLEGLEPNMITFTSVLHGCAHAGLLREGMDLFQTIQQEHLSLEHFHCVIDLLGRVGRVQEAEELISSMPFEPGVITWTTLAGATRVHGQLACAARSSDFISRLKPDDSGPYILFSNIYNELLPDEEEELHL